MGAGLHGNDGLDPDTSIHILQIYILPLLVYGLEVLLPRKTLMEKVEILQETYETGTLATRYSGRPGNLHSDWFNPNRRSDP